MQHALQQADVDAHWTLWCEALECAFQGAEKRHSPEPQLRKHKHGHVHVEQVQVGETWKLTPKLNTDQGIVEASAEAVRIRKQANRVRYVADHVRAAQADSLSRL
eukprot:15451487-Alexandrium_andersonii.AAC.1